MAPLRPLALFFLPYFLFCVMDGCFVLKAYRMCNDLSICMSETFSLSGETRVNEMLQILSFYFHTNTFVSVIFPPPVAIASQLLRSRITIN